MTLNVPTAVNDMGPHRVHTFIVPRHDGFLQPKHVAKILQYYQFADIYMLRFQTLYYNATTNTHAIGRSLLQQLTVLLLFCRARWLMPPDVPQPVRLIVLTLR
jgi:hypothetical protein